VRSLVLAVRHPAVEGRVAERLARTSSTPRGRATVDARAQPDPGPRIVLPPEPATIDLARGKAFDDASCAACHDADGRGKLREDRVDNPVAARDFTAGQFKGGSTLDDIALRVTRGISGTPMPGSAGISGDDLWSVAAYVRTVFAPVRPQSSAPSR
jgi:mono/diheme cytochrome c family protein